MAWKRQTTSRDLDVTVDLSSFTVAELLQGLIDKSRIGEGEAEAILARTPLSALDGPKIGPGETDTEMAILEAKRGRIGEAIIHLERATGLVGVLTPHFRA